VVAFVLGMSSMAYGMRHNGNQVTNVLLRLPSADILKKRLVEKGYEEFVQSTQIHRVLGGKSRHFAAIVSEVARALELSEPASSHAFCPIMLAIVQDYPLFYYYCSGKIEYKGHIL
jgi:hypothetical protein